MSLRFRKNDHAHNLLVAVARWVKANKGNVIVAGGIGIMDYPGDAKYSFRVVIKCTGKKPVPTVEETKND